MKEIFLFSLNFYHIFHKSFATSCFYLVISIVFLFITENSAKRISWTESEIIKTMWQERMAGVQSKQERDKGMNLFYTY